MRNTTRSALLAVLVLAPASIAWTNRTDGALTLAPQSRLWFDGTSTVRAFTCTAGELEANVATTVAGAVSAVAIGEKAISTVQFRVPAKKLDCQHGKMNEHMQKALMVTQHPQVTYTVASYTLTKSDSGMQAVLTGTLSLGGVVKPIVVTAKAKEEAGMLRVTGKQTIAMSDFGIKAPTLMMNTLKVGNQVTVGFDLLLKN